MMSIQQLLLLRLLVYFMYQRKLGGENILPGRRVKALYRLNLGTSFVDANNAGIFKVRIETKHNGSFLSVVNCPLLPCISNVFDWLLAHCIMVELLSFIMILFPL